MKQPLLCQPETAEGATLCPTRRKVLRAGIATLWSVSQAFIARTESARANGSLRIRNYFSPLNRKRPRRPYTEFIVLHTTEGADNGSLNKVRRYGETHYFVATNGTVYRIIDKSKIATHAGRSMWNGKRNLDDYSIGIEITGYHNKDITAAQYEACKELLRQLKSLYRIADANVLTHSMVAYGRPNRFHPNDHRGRKRCGMIFARPDVRARLGLDTKPDHDEDVALGRLKVADPELQAFLYTKASNPLAAGQEQGTRADQGTPAESSIIAKGWNAWSIAREQYNSPETIYLLPGGTRLRGDEIQDWSKIPVGTQVLLSEAEETQGFEGFLEIGKDGDTVRDLAGEKYADRTTIYFFRDGLIRTGYELQQYSAGRFRLQNPSKGTRILVGYVYGGHVKTSRLPVSIAGRKWNYPSTFYRLPDGSIISGDDIDASAIPPNTLIFYRN